MSLKCNLAENLNILLFFVKVHELTKYRHVWYHFTVSLNKIIDKHIYLSQKMKISKLVGPMMPLIGKQLGLSAGGHARVSRALREQPLNWYYAT